MRGHRDLTAATATAVFCAAVVLIVPLEAVELLAAVPLALFLPGYAITAAAFGERQLERPLLLVMGVALSVATLAIGALILNYTPGGIRGWSWTALLVVVVLGGCLVAARRRPQPEATTRPWSGLKVKRSEWALMVGAVVAVGVAMGLAWTPLPARDAVGYTRLWISPLSDNEGTGVSVGVASEQQDPMTYSLEVKVGGRRVAAPSRLTLRPGEESVLQINTRPPPPGTRLPVSAQLFRQNDPDAVYRQVYGWIPDS